MDSNGARVAVTENYMAQCNGFCVVAPIIRAVDDKAAKNLMGESFKRQMQLDGTYTNTIMICSKTDHITVTEATKDLDGVWRRRAMDVKSQMEETENLQEEKSATMAEVNKGIEDLISESKHIDTRVQELIVALTGLPQTCNDGAAYQGKRKLSETPVPEAKRPTTKDGGSVRASSMPIEPRTPETQEEVVQEIGNLQAKKHEVSKTRDNLDARVGELEREQRELCQQILVLQAQEKKQCIQNRNDIVRSAMKRDYAEGIRQLDQDQGSEEDLAGFDPTVAARNYKKLAEDFEVFCVSSHAYLQLCGKLCKDTKITGYESKEDTEMPALQRRAMCLAESTRSTACRTFLKEFLQLLNSLTLQLKMNETPLELENELKEEERKHLLDSVAQLKLQFESAERALWDKWDAEVQRIIVRLADGVQVCKQQAGTIASSWFKAKAKGGIPYNTFRAACLRDGKYANHNGDINLNEDLIKPLKRSFARRWEMAFEGDIPRALEVFGASRAGFLRSLRIDMQERERLKCSGGSLRAMTEVVRGHGYAMRDVHAKNDFLAAHQRKATRLMDPCIAAIMSAGYRGCVNEKGMRESKT